MKKKPTEKELEEVLYAFVYALISTTRDIADFIQKYELYGTLTKNEAQMLNSIQIAVREYLDIEEINQAKELKNGKLG